MNKNNLLYTMRLVLPCLVLPLMLMILCPVDCEAASAQLVGSPRISTANYELDITYSVNFKGCRGQEVYWGVHFSEYPNGPLMRDDEGNTLVLYPLYIYNAPGGRPPHNNRMCPGYDNCNYDNQNMKMALLRFFEQGRKYYLRFFFVMDYLRPKRYPQELVLYDIVNLGCSDWYEFSY